MSKLSKQNNNTAGTIKRSAPKFEKMVAAYATAASAAVGVGLLGAVPSAEAKVVYTQTNVTITTTSSYALDLNHDGVPDFDINFCACLPHAVRLQIGLDVSGNLVREQKAFPEQAAALLRGVTIGPKEAFTSFTSGYGGVFMADAGGYGSSSYSNGPWLNVKGRYLGLKFLINGQVHYGWARLNTTHQLGSVVLTGYAYETVANKPLNAGQTSGAAQIVAVDPALLADPFPTGPGLGLLACGADALDVWRKTYPTSTTLT